MSLGRKSAQHGNFGEWNPALRHQCLRLSNAPFDNVAMRRFAGSRFECAGEMVRAEVHFVRESIDRKRFGEVAQERSF